VTANPGERANLGVARTGEDSGITVLLVDGTYELFRHFFGRRPRGRERSDVDATVGTVRWIVSLLESGTTHLGVATDHVIESFRNDLWPGYKTSAGVPPELLEQFPLLEDALAALGVVVWAMERLEADDALASVAGVAAHDRRVAQVVIATPDKDLAQCVSGRRVVQLDSRSGRVIDQAAVVERFGVQPASIPDWLALVGDAADGFPGLPGWGRVSASAVLARYGHLEAVPDSLSEWDPALRRVVRGASRLAQTLCAERRQAQLFRRLATLERDPSLLADVALLRWPGPTKDWPSMCERLGDSGLSRRIDALVKDRCERPPSPSV
jgi:5'-3' exonuclease